ncbi:hypothetical protein ANCCEY_12376 [Ancylostoma ceylanicum]|uniref:Tetraspanin family protein n=1 Tax=Ancylostoma ceylanicum TaxID=53326 RepID=A0A0D6L9E2_9BILA|nr:hypothetical protein ANCCEY_12376 [Ancylostoma ceylanicum]
MDTTKTSANYRQYIESSMYDTIRNRYASDANYKAAFDTIQQEFECCGVKTYADWLGASWDRKQAAQTDSSEARIEHGIGAVGGGRGNGYGRVPTSCCNAHGKETYPTNCGVSFTHAPLETYSDFLHPTALFTFQNPAKTPLTLACTKTSFSREMEGSKVGD